MTRTQPFSAGVMISASHNPARDNGVKIFAADGSKLPDAVETEVAELTSRIEFDRIPETKPQAAPRVFGCLPNSLGRDVCRSGSRGSSTRARRGQRRRLEARSRGPPQPGSRSDPGGVLARRHQHQPRLRCPLPGEPDRSRPTRARPARDQPGRRRGSRDLCRRPRHRARRGTPFSPPSVATGTGRGACPRTRSSRR